MWCRKFILTLAIGLAPVGLWAGPLDDGLAAYEAKDYEKALRLLKPLAENGNAAAQHHMGWLYGFGLGVEEDGVEAVRWFRLAAEQGHVDSELLLGTMNEFGWLGVEQNYFEAVRWYRLAAEQGDAYGQFNLGRMHEDGHGVNKDNAEAVRRYRLAAEQGHSQAQYQLARMLYLGLGVTRNTAEAARWAHASADQGNADGRNGLGVLHTLGEGVPLDLIEAARLFRAAAEQGNPKAQRNIAMALYDGKGVPQDRTEAKRLYQSAFQSFSQLATQNDPEAQYHLGLMYEAGQGVEQDYREAARWYHLAAEQGYALAQYNLGAMYASGQGVPQDEREAVRWYRLAAEQGYAEAQFTLGVLYDKGRGVSQDYREAIRWYRSAAEQGNGDAQFLLAAMYALGLGVPQDFVQAHLWYNLAGAQGHEDAMKLRDGLAEMMTPAQIAEAQRLAREWRPRERGSEGSTAAIVPRAPAERPAEPKSSGSGFVVSNQGHLLTNQHVVDSCARLTVRTSVARQAASLIRADARNDLALLRIPEKPPAQGHFREGRGIRAGDSVVVLGYPLSGLLASEANVTTGTISALSGPGDDSRLIQITAPVQPGSSGGPILDNAGNIVGIVVSKLDALKVAAAIGDIPQNVNFGIHASVARTFLDANGVDYATAPAERTIDPATIAAEAKAYTVLIECW